MRWWFKFGLMALGRSVHAALGENFAQKVDTREDLLSEGVVVLFREAWTNEIEQTEFRDEEDLKTSPSMEELLSQSTWTKWRPLSIPP